MKTAFLTLVLLCTSGISIAQQGTVQVKQDRELSQLLNLYKKANESADFYTIQIGFGSYDKAQKLKSDAEVDFPGWYTKIIFDSPTYRVHVGKFNTKLEGERHFTEVRKKYPESLLLSPKN
ncbi:SPOR domain-containing protein [Zeaxanthinibacter enoshimensis]|uniref:SPOR domain-containing protein n=1 Tax=Zeaxanthinibacter enoshimensis TaxID=392009 RepID=UPI0035691882